MGCCERGRRGAAAAVVAVLALLLAGCSSDEDLFTPPVTIAVGTDAPGMHFQGEANQRTGFDVDFYRWIASSVPDPFVPAENDVNVEDRTNVLRTGQDRMVFSSFAITGPREQQVDFSAPYLQTYQGVLVRAGNTAIRTVGDLAGKSVCAQSESTSIGELRTLPGLSVVEKIGLDQCVTALEQGAIDAVSTDQILLYGWAQARPALQVVPNLTFGAIGRYGIGLPPGPGTARCEQANVWIKRFIDQGQWDLVFRSNFPTVDPTPFKPSTQNMKPCVEDDDGVA